MIMYLLFFLPVMVKYYLDPHPFDYFLYSFKLNFWATKNLYF